MWAAYAYQFPFVGYEAQKTHKIPNLSSPRRSCLTWATSVSSARGSRCSGSGHQRDAAHGRALEILSLISAEKHRHHLGETRTRVGCAESRPSDGTAFPRSCPCACTRVRRSASRSTRVRPRDGRQLFVDGLQSRLRPDTASGCPNHSGRNASHQPAPDGAEVLPAVPPS